MAQAIAAYESAFDKGKSAAIALKLFRGYRQEGSGEKAIASLEDWLQVQPTDSGVRLMLASAYQSLGRPGPAIDHYERILADEPKNLVVLNNLAWIYQEQGDSRALEYAERAYSVAPDRPEVLDTIGWVFVHNGRVQRGLELLQDAKVQAPHLPTISYHYAYALHKANRTDEAKKELQRLLRDHKVFAEREQAQQLLNKL